MSATCKPLALSGWYEHRDGTWGFYTWQVAEGRVELVPIIIVGTQAETAGPAPERLRAMREHFAGRDDKQGVAWCTLALHGHDVAVARAIELDRQLCDDLNARAVVAATHGVPLSAVHVMHSEPELAQRCPHGSMPRDAGAGHWREWHRGHGCHLDPDRGAKP